MEPEDEGKVFPETKFLIFKNARLSATTVLTVWSLGTRYQGTRLAVEYYIEFLYRNVDDYQSAPRNIPEVRTSLFNSEAEA